MITSKSVSVYKPSLDVLQSELEAVNVNIKLMHDYKEEVITEIEGKKLNLRQLTDTNKIYAYFKKNGRKFEKPKIPVFSTVIRERIISVLDREISLIQNQYDLIYNELKVLKSDLEDRGQIVEKTELIMNVLNYKTYEIRYNFRKKIDALRESKDTIAKEGAQGSETHVAVQRVEIDKEISECEQLFESQIMSIKEQKLEAQKQYEQAVNILDDNLEMMRKHYNILLLLIEAEKAQLSDSQNELIEIKYAPITQQLQEEIDSFTELQTVGWKTKQSQARISVLLQDRGLKFTSSGLLVTASGQRITYEEARDLKLLDNIDFSLEFFKDLEAKDSEEELSSKSKDSKSSDYSRMTSEDVQYLKENLGTPLTLALAEITAVQPRDPIHYLAHWLFKYRYNQEVGEIQRMELEQLTNERDRLAREKWHKFIEEEARAAVLEMIFRAEEEAMRNEILRIQRELEALENEDEENDENYEDEARDKFDTYGTEAIK